MQTSSSMHSPHVMWVSHSSFSSMTHCEPFQMHPILAPCFPHPPSFLYFRHSSAP